MVRTRFTCPSLLNHHVHSTKAGDEKYFKNLLPVKDGLFSTDDVCGCNGNETSGKIWALEVLTKYMLVPDNESNRTTDVIDIAYPTWIAEKVLLQLLPQPLAHCASEGGDLLTPVKACAWFEDDKSTSNSGSEPPVLQEIKLDVEDLPWKLATQSKKTSVELSSPVDYDNDHFLALKAQDSELAPLSSPHTLHQETALRRSSQILRTRTNSEADFNLADKPFETHFSDDCEMWNFPAVSDSKNEDQGAILVLTHPKADDHEDLDDLPGVLDSLCPTTFMVDECTPDLGIARQCPQQRGPPTREINNFLEDFSLDSNLKALKQLRIHNTLEKPKFIENDRFEQIPIPELRSCDPDVKTTSNPLVLVDLTGPDDSSPHNFMAPDAKANNTIRYQERRLLLGTSASVCTSTLTNEGFSCVTAENDNSDHSTLSDEKITSSTGPRESYSVKFGSNTCISDLSLKNRSHAYKQDTSQKPTEALKMHRHVKEVPLPLERTDFDQLALYTPLVCTNCTMAEKPLISTNLNFNNCRPATKQKASENVPGQNCPRPDKTRVKEAIYQHRGSTSVSEASSEGISWAVTAPTHATSTIPSRHLETQDLSFKKCLGSRDMNKMKRQPLVIVAANVMQPDGSVLLQRRSSYQRVLALENEQLQVVERERHLPADLILNPSTCLIVYTAETMKLNRNKTSSLGYMECSAFIVDIIINCHMKAMSFSFEKCFMIFEGEPAHTSFILQAMPKLAIAAGGFGMRVQGFVSRNPQCTEQLALACIERIQNKARRPYPSLMSECETDGELFLEQFPSLNPLAAHAILCLNVPLSTFLLWSHDVMVEALQGFGVPMESLKLFKLQSEHGKLKEGQGPRSIRPLKEAYPDNFLSLPPASGHYSDFEIDFDECFEAQTVKGNPISLRLGSIFELDPLGNDPASDEDNAMIFPPFEPALWKDPNFFSDFTSETNFNIWDDSYPKSEQEHLPIQPWPEERPTQRTIKQRSSSNRTQKRGYIQSCLDDWIENIKRDKMSIIDSMKPESKCGSLLDPTRASRPNNSKTHQQDSFPMLNFEPGPRHGHKAESTAPKKTLRKRPASALDHFRHQKGTSHPLPKKLKLLSRPHLRPLTVADIVPAQAARAQFSKRSICIPSRFSRPP